MDTGEYFKYFPKYIYSVKIFTIEILVFFFVNSFSVIYISNFEKPTELIHLIILLFVWSVPVTSYTLFRRYYKKEWDLFELSISQSDVIVWILSSLLIYITSVYYLFTFTTADRIFDIVFYMAPVLYSIRLWSLVKLYDSKYKFYIDAGSYIEDLWIYSSRSLQKSYQLTDTDNRLYNLYGLVWSLMSISRFEILKENINSNTKYTYLGAEKYTKAAFTLAKLHLAFIYDKPNSEIQERFQEFESHIRDANELLQNRRCSSCGDVHPKDNMYYIQNEDSETIYCKSCYQVYTEGKSRSKKQKQNYQREQRKRKRKQKRKRQKQKRKQRANASSNTNETSESKSKDTSESTNWNNTTQTTSSSKMTIQKAASVLNVNDTTDKDKVKKAYREAVKEAHPDTEGGSEEEFKQVQEAKKRLMD